LNYNERSTLYNAHLLYKLSEFKKLLKDYMTSFSCTDVFNNCSNYNFHKYKQLEIIELLLQIIEEINVSKILSNYLLQLKVQRIHHGWTGRATKIFYDQGVGNV
jgi:hypothetical protein